MALLDVVLGLGNTVLIVIGIVLFVLICVLVYFTFRKKNNQIQTTTNQQNLQGIPSPKQNEINVVKDDKPLFRIEQPTIPNLPDSKDQKNINVRYPLIPPYTFARVRWDDPSKELVYEIEEPQLNDNEKKVLEILEEGIKELINLSFISVSDKDTIILYLEKNIKVLLTELSIQISMESYLKIMYYIYRDFVGLNELEPLMNDYFIEDVECNGVNSPIYIVHRKYRNIRTNLIYKDVRKLASFVEKLAQKCGRYVSYAEPLLDGSLPDGSLDYHEPVIYRKNGIVKIGKIGEIIDPYYTPQEADKPVLTNELEVAAFDTKTFKISWRKAQYVYRHKINEELYELSLEFGRKIKLTGCHSVFVLKNQGVFAERTDHLKIGDYVVLPTHLPENNFIKEINLAKELSVSSRKDQLILRDVPEEIYAVKKEALKTYYRAQYKLPNSAYSEHRKKRILPLALYYLLTEQELRTCFIGTTSTHKIPSFLPITQELMWFLGLYIAEGWLYDYQSHGVSFSLNKYEGNLIEELRRSAKTCFNLDISLDSPVDGGIKVHVGGLLPYLIMKEVLQVSGGAKTKKVPVLVFNVSRALQQDFIKAWHTGDYSTTTSKDLATEISYLALFSGDIAAFYKSPPKTTYIKCRAIANQGAYYSKFYDRSVTNPYPTMIPVELFNPLNKTHERLRNKRVSRERLQMILAEARYQRFENFDLATNKFILEWKKRGFVDDFGLTTEGKKLLEEITTVKRLLDSDFAFAKIKKIGRVPSSSEYVYDFSVAGDENFVGGIGGICCHNSRINATYSTDVSSKGPTFTCRKFTREPWSPLQLMIKGTCSAEIYSYLWMAVEYENSLMIVGGTGSGKTSFVNTVAFFIPPQARVVSIEDTRELQLEHENWLPSVARSGVGLANLVGQKYGEVSLFDLLRASFRQRPDYIIVGEVRGKEAFVLFQAFASGHPGMATMHAENVSTLIRRLETNPINLSGSLIETLSAVVVMSQTKIKGKEVRKVSSVDEIIQVKESGGGEITNNVFSWDPKTDIFKFNPNSKVFEKIAIHFGFTKEQVLNEFKIRTRLLNALFKKGVVGFKEVQAVIQEYYKSPELVLKRYGVI